MSFKARISAQFIFEAAHQMKVGYPEGHPNLRLHGHSYLAKVVLFGEVNPEDGMLCQLEDLEAELKKVQELLDHSCLNEVEGLEHPSSEFLAYWIWQKLKVALPKLEKVIVERSHRGITAEYCGDD